MPEPKSDVKRIQKIAIIIGTRCNFRCAHCLIEEKDRIYNLTSVERRVLYKTVVKFRPKAILFSGGEPTLYKRVINNIISAHPDKKNLKVTLTTNGHFAKNITLAKRTISSFIALDCIQLSYDEFHKVFLPLSNVKNLYLACKESGVKFGVILTISSPLNLAIVRELRSIGQFKIGLQKVANIGEAKNNNIKFPFQCFDKKVLSKYCPNRRSMGYICGKGFSICCAELIFNNPTQIFAHKALEEHIKSDFYRLMRTKNFGELSRMAKISQKSLLPEHSSECALCEYIFQKLYADKLNLKFFR